MAQTVIRVEFDAGAIDAASRMVVRSLDEIEQAAGLASQGIDGIESNLIRLQQAALRLDNAAPKALGDFARSNPVNGLSGSAPKNTDTRQILVATINPLAREIGRVLFRILVEKAIEALIEEFGSLFETETPKSSAEQIEALSAELEKVQNRLSIIEGNEELKISDSNLAALRSAEAELRRQIAAITEERASIREEAFTGPVVEPKAAVTDAGQQLAETMFRQVQEIQAQTLGALQTMQETFGAIPNALQEISQALQEVSQGTERSPVAEPDRSLGPLQEPPGEMTRLLQDVLTELTRLLQEIEGAALLGKRCEGAMPVPGLPQPGLPGSQDPTDGALCPTEQLERQSDCLLLEGGEATNGLQAGLLAYAQSALDVNEQMKSATLSAFQGMEDALVSFVQTGKLEFGSLVDSMIADLIRLTLRAAILGPLADAIAGALAPGSPVGTSAGAVNAPFPGEPPRPLTNTITPNIRRNIRTPAAARPGAGDFKIDVVINNTAPNANVQAQGTTDGRGQPRLEIEVSEISAREMRRPGSPLNRATGQSFRGLTPSFTPRS